MRITAHSQHIFILGISSNKIDNLAVYLVEGHATAFCAIEKSKALRII
jgi:hypothetical protein